MNKFLFAVCIAMLGAAACSSGNANTKTDADGNTLSSQNAKYQIIDQEFDNLLAPNADYDTIPDYELQACGDSYLPPTKTPLKGSIKPAVKRPVQSSVKEEASAPAEVTANKKVINNTNIYYLDGTAPDTVSSSSTTTTYTSEEALPAADLPDTL